MSCARYDRSLVRAKFHHFSLFNGWKFSCSDYPGSPFISGTSKGSVGLAGPGVHRAIWQLFFALIVQVLLVTFTIGTKVPSGIIIPSMSIGAITGRIIGIITEQLAIQNPTFILFRHDCSKGNSNGDFFSIKLCKSFKNFLCRWKLCDACFVCYCWCLCISWWC